MLKKYQIIFIVAALGFTSCIRDAKKPGREYMPDMVESAAYEAGSPNPIFKDGKTDQLHCKVVSQEVNIFTHCQIQTMQKRLS